MFRLMVTGSRTWSDTDAIVAELQFVAKKYKNVVLVSGHAEGADEIAEEVAVGMGWVVETYVPNWKEDGRSAGYKRNSTMLDTGVDAVLAFHKDESKGTADAIRKAQGRKIPTRIIVESTPEWLKEWGVQA